MSASELAISVRGISKAYAISHDVDHHSTLAESMLHRLRHPFQRQRRETFRALNDISFDVRKGDVVGIVGRNGAGKSTLLKILSRITEPSSGEIDLYGRVGSLLEVGTGFHPELTGRENIFLNGAIMGMSKAEIRKHFDAIVDFADIERFLDTPVKRYSSGMYVRLAFAVAAYLNPEILIVDEVLAVGDAEFQKKCLGKMKEVSAQQGRTVLFVSHNMPAVQKLCDRAMLLEFGSLTASGDVGPILERYISSGASSTYIRTAPASGPYVTAVKVLTETLRTDAELRIQLEWVLPERTPGIKVGVGFNCLLGQRVFDSMPEDAGQTIPPEPGRYSAVFRVPPNTLLARQYGVSVGLWNAQTVFDHVVPALTLALEAAPAGPYSHERTREGLVHVNGEWTMSSEGER